MHGETISQQDHAGYRGNDTEESLPDVLMDQLQTDSDHRTLASSENFQDEPSISGGFPNKPTGSGVIDILNELSAGCLHDTATSALRQANCARQTSCSYRRRYQHHSF